MRQNVENSSKSDRFSTSIGPVLSEGGSIGAIKKTPSRASSYYRLVINRVQTDKIFAPSQVRLCTQKMDVGGNIPRGTLGDE